jgi:hypothetical protein
LSSGREATLLKREPKRPTSEVRDLRSEDGDQRSEVEREDFSRRHGGHGEDGSGNEFRVSAQERKRVDRFTTPLAWLATHSVAGLGEAGFGVHAFG